MSDTLKLIAQGVSLYPIADLHLGAEANEQALTRSGELTTMEFTPEVPQETAPRITIFGDAGMGKTSFAASFPKPIVIRAEDGLQSIPAESRPHALPLLTLPIDKATKKSTGMPPIIDQLRWLASAEHDYQTVIIDSITKLEAMYITRVVDASQEDNANVKSINQAGGGYGAGREEVVAQHRMVKEMCDFLAKKRGMTVVFIAHADVKRIDPPDSQSYTRYDLRLHDKSLPPYIDDVDIVGFIRMETYVKTDKADSQRRKAVSDGTRELVCYAQAANVSKNRYNINQPLVIPFDKETGTVTANPLLQLIPFYQTGA